MDFDYNSEQIMLRESAKKLLAKECTSEHVREMVHNEKGYSPELWNKMAELGWMSLLIPEEYNGSGGKFLDLTILLTEMGYYALPGPFFSTVVLGGLAVLEAGTEAQKAEILPGLAGGKHMMTIACMEKEGLFSPKGINLWADINGDVVTLSGVKLFVPDAHVADTIICVARTAKVEDGISLFLVDAKTEGVHIKALDTQAGEKQCEVVFKDVKVSKLNLLGEINKGWSILESVSLKAAVAKCAEMSGGAEKAMDLVVTYAKERVQFGKPIAAFQAIQHHCANMRTYADTSQLMTKQAAWKISEGLQYEIEASMCKAWVSDSYRK
ncbi:MAG: acyl-CoA dehydrogenase, partial [Deltaproteobacteria bacterium HGW-Deltaproteobacteria-10]